MKTITATSPDTTTTLPSAPPADRLLRRPEVLYITGLSGPSALKRAIAEADFPKPVRLTARSIAWRLSAVLAWIESRPEVGEGEE
jgi:prophage regulatory protein